MSTKEKVDAYYTKHYDSLLDYVMNKKRGGVGVNVATDEATEVVHDTYIYHATHPEHFDERYMKNVLKQRRINYIRDKENYNSLKDDFFVLYYTGGKHENESPIERSLVKKELQGIIKQEIRSTANKKHRAVLQRHIIEGEAIPDKCSTEKVIVYRFRNKMIAQYGEVFRDG